MIFRLYVAVTTGHFSGVTLLEAGHVKSISLYGKLSMPVASPVASFVAKGTAVTLTSVEGADIHYTLDGSTPDENSMLYTSGIEITGKCTIKAVAVKEGWTTRDVFSAQYAIASAPEPKISISGDGIVTITSEVEDAVIHYTLDGRSPNELSPVYDPNSKPVLESENITVSAIAVSPRYEGSSRATEYYLPLVSLTEDGFEQLSKRHSCSTLLLDFKGHGYYGLIDDVPCFRMEAGDEDYLMCIKDKREIRYIKIKNEERNIKINILASEKNLSVVDLYETDILETLTIGDDCELEFTFPDNNNYNSIAILPDKAHQCNVLEFEVGLK